MRLSVHDVQTLTWLRHRWGALLRPRLPGGGVDPVGAAEAIRWALELVRANELNEAPDVPLGITPIVASTSTPTPTSASTPERRKRPEKSYAAPAASKPDVPAPRPVAEAPVQPAAPSKVSPPEVPSWRERLEQADAGILNANAVATPKAKPTPAKTRKQTTVHVARAQTTPAAPTVVEPPSGLTGEQCEELVTRTQAILIALRDYTARENSYTEAPKHARAKLFSSVRGARAALADQIVGINKFRQKHAKDLEPLPMPPDLTPDIAGKDLPDLDTRFYKEMVLAWAKALCGEDSDTFTAVRGLDGID
jgi:hypothetical protein